MAALELGRTAPYEAWLTGAFDAVVATTAIDAEALQSLRDSGLARRLPEQVAARRKRRAAPTAAAPKVAAPKQGARQETSPNEAARQVAAPKEPGAAAPVRVVPNAVDLAYWRRPEGPRSPDTVILSGKFSYHANETAALWLLEEVMPHVWAERPATRLVLAGASPGRALVRAAAVAAAEGPERVTVTGTVGDLRPWLHASTVAVAPMVYGAGVQNKLLEAFASAVPAVATPPAADAIGAVSDQDLLVAAEPRDFASAVIGVLSDALLGDRLGAAGLALAERRFAPAAVLPLLEDAYAAAIATRGRA
jgi:glycosyltransferase involved in cell wall biosynthesis